MKKRGRNLGRASTFQVALSTGLISISAILLAIAAPVTTEKAPRQDRSGFQLRARADADSIRTLGTYPDSSVPLSGDMAVTPDAPPSNTTSINVSTDTNFEGKLEGDPMTGVARVTNAHPAGTFTVTVTAFDGGGVSATKTFTLTVTTPATCPQVNFAAVGNFDVNNYPRAVAVGDFNGDGKQDLATATDFSVSILLGDGTGHFSAATDFVTDSSYSIAVGDFNGDGKQDLATSVYGFGFVSILLGDGAGHFSAATNFNVGGLPRSIVVGDFNGDGKQDIAVSRYGSSATVSILLGDGTGNFSTATSFGPGGDFSSIARGDFDGDGKQDLAVASQYSNNVSILLGDGMGNFGTATNFDAGTEPVSLAVGDFNADGKQDLAVANSYSADVSILLGDGAGHFSAPTNFVAGGGPLSVAVGDFNGDGKQDLAFANSVTNNASILLGDGAGHFGAPIYFDVGTSGGNPSSVAVGDFNGDGKQDLAVPAFNNASDNVTILLRDCAAPTPTPSATPTTTHFLLSDPGNVYGGFAFYLRVTAKDQFNTTATGYPGIVHFTSTDPAALLPPDSPLPNGTALFMPTLRTLGYQTITATDTSDPSISGTSNPILVLSEQPSPVPSPSPTATASPTATVTATATVSPTPTATASPTPTATPAPAQSLNLSSRMLVQTGDRVGIAGLIITGSSAKRVIVRAVHCMICIPEVFPLVDPVLELHGPGGFATIINDNWRDTQEAEIIATGLAPDNDSDSAIVVTLPPGNYTAIVRGQNNTSGVALVEVYDLSQTATSKLANISTRAFVSTGGDILIAGFILGNGTMPDNMIVRGLGPSLAGLGVPGALADPTLELRDSNGALIRANNNWQDDPTQAALISTAGLAPTSTLESGIAATLSPGQYTALLDGLNNGTGVGLVEVYDLGAP